MPQPRRGPASLPFILVHPPALPHSGHVFGVPPQPLAAPLLPLWVRGDKESTFPDLRALYGKVRSVSAWRPACPPLFTVHFLSLQLEKREFPLRWSLSIFCCASLNPWRNRALLEPPASAVPPSTWPASVWGGLAFALIP